MFKLIKNILALIFIFLQLSIPLKAYFNNSVNTVKKEINRNDIKTAIKLLGEIEITSNNEKERIDLLFGDIYLKINKPQKAIEFYESAFMTSDEGVESLSELGLAEAYLRKGNLKESIKHAKRSLEINSDKTRGKIFLAIGLTKNGEKDEALKIYREFDLQKLHFKESYINYSNLLIVINKLHKALEVINNFILEDKNNLEALRQRSLINKLLSNFDKSEEDLLKSIQIDKLNIVSNQMIVKFYIDKKNYEEAIKYCDLMLIEKRDYNFFLLRKYYVRLI